MMLDNDRIFFSQILVKFIYIQTIYRIITTQFTVATESRCKQQDLFLLKLRIFLIKLIGDLLFICLIKEHICSWDTGCCHLVLRNTKTFCIKLRNIFRADQCVIVITMVWTLLGLTSRPSHTAAAEGLESSTGMPQLNQIGILSPRHPEEKLTIIIHQDHFGIAKIPCHPDQTADPHLLDFITVQHITAVKLRHAVQIMIYKLKIACKVITAV